MSKRKMQRRTTHPTALPFRPPHSTVASKPPAPLRPIRRHKHSKNSVRCRLATRSWLESEGMKGGHRKDDVVTRRRRRRRWRTIRGYVSGNRGNTIVGAEEREEQRSRDRKRRTPKKCQNTKTYTLNNKYTLSVFAFAAVSPVLLGSDTLCADLHISWVVGGWRWREFDFDSREGGEAGWRDRI